MCFCFKQTYYYLVFSFKYIDLYAAICQVGLNNWLPYDSTWYYLLLLPLPWWFTFGRRKGQGSKTLKKILSPNNFFFHLSGSLQIFLQTKLSLRQTFWRRRRRKKNLTDNLSGRIHFVWEFRSPKWQINCLGYIVIIN